MRSRLSFGIALVCLLALSIGFGLSRRTVPHVMDVVTLGPPILDPSEVVAFVCPIHPDYTSSSAGACPRDGMTLVRANPYDPRDYELRLDVTPSVPRVGQPTSLRFRIFHPGTGEEVTELITVHDQPYHLFLISQDMEHFEHLHPTQSPDRSWSIDVTLPRPGYYKLLSDFVPNGGSAQFLAHPLVTAGYEGDLIDDGARLSPSPDATLTSGDLTATVSTDPATFLSGLYAHLTFTLRDADTGRLVTDLQPYLGSFGHILIMSEDLVDYVHSHPLDPARSDEETGPVALMLPMGVDRSTLRGGPEVTFEGRMPKPGLYRAWSQFRRDDQIHTFSYTFSVEGSG